MLLINRLKSYHFSLEEIKTMINVEENQAEEKLIFGLQRKRKEVQAKIHAYEYTLTQLNQDILRADMGKSMMSWLDDIEVELSETQPMNILYIRQMMSSDDYALGYEKYFSWLYERIAVNKLTLLGTPMTIYHSPEYNPAGNDTEFAIPIEETVRETRYLHGSLCAKSVLKGPYAELTSVYAKLREWVDDEGYDLAQSPYEVYVTDHQQAGVPEDIVTEVYFPIKKKER